MRGSEEETDPVNNWEDEEYKSSVLSENNSLQGWFRHDEKTIADEKKGSETGGAPEGQGYGSGDVEKERVRAKDGSFDGKEAS